MFKDRFDQSPIRLQCCDSESKKMRQTKDLKLKCRLPNLSRMAIFSALQTEGARMQAQFAERTAASQAEGAQAAMQGAQGAMSTVTMIDAIVHGINDTVQGIKGSFDLIADMADSFRS